MVVLTPDSPEGGWPPFMEWLTEHGIDPALCWEVKLGDGEDPRCVAHLYATNELGVKYVIGDRLAIREPVAFMAQRPAPLRRPTAECWSPPRTRSRLPRAG